MCYCGVARVALHLASAVVAVVVVAAAAEAVAVVEATAVTSSECNQYILDHVPACGRLFPMLGGDATFFFVIFIVAFLAGQFRRWCFGVDFQDGDVRRFELRGLGLMGFRMCGSGVWEGKKKKLP